MPRKRACYYCENEPLGAKAEQFGFNKTLCVPCNLLVRRMRTLRRTVPISPEAIREAKLTKRVILEDE